MKSICISGGAIGADTVWGNIAKICDYDVIHYIFDGHKSKEENLVVLTPEQLSVANEHLEIANKTLGRHFPSNSEFVNNLLRRNYYQVVDSDSLYAISTIKDNKVQGGTAWAVQMFLDMGKTQCYVYDQVIKEWFSFINGTWTKIGMPPVPSGIWAGVGTRDINDNGVNAIVEVLSQNEL